MPRANRYFVAGHAYHLTHRCHNRQFLLRFAQDRDRYRKVLREGILEFEVSLLDFCVTSNHTHLLVTADETQTVSAFMQKVQGVFAQAYNRRNGRTGAFWSDRFHSTMIEPGRHLQECLVYIALNMVRCGAVKHPDQWRWCGYDELAGIRQRYRLLDLERLLWLLGGVGILEFRKNYEAMIQQRIAEDSIRREPQWTESVAVGSEAFVREIASRVRGRQDLELIDQGNRWVLRETAVGYSVRSVNPNDEDIRPAWRR